MLECEHREDESLDRDAARVTIEVGLSADRQRVERDGLWSGVAEEEKGRRLLVVTIVRPRR